MKPRFGSSFWSPEGTPVSSPESCLLEATCVPCQVSNSRPFPHPLHLFKLTNHLIFCAYVCSVPMSAQVQVHTGAQELGSWETSGTACLFLLLRQSFLLAWNLQVGWAAWPENLRSPRLCLQNAVRAYVIVTRSFCF